LAKRAALAAILIVAAAAAAAFVARPRPARDIHIVARDMTFYVDGAPEPNPVLRLRAGEIVRLVLTNADPGMKHDFAIDDWRAATSLVTSGGVTSVIVRVPAAKARVPYHCTPHEETMRGTIIVE
jgi:plastocyanin